MGSSQGSSKILWIIPLGCLGVFALACGGCLVMFYGAYAAITNNEAYAGSLKRAQEDPRVIAELGEPIEAGWAFQGNINYDGDGGNADFSYPISGPNGGGQVEVEATSQGGNWTFHELIVTANGKKIDLLGEEGIVVDGGGTDETEIVVEPETEEAAPSTGESETPEN